MDQCKESFKFQLKWKIPLSLLNINTKKYLQAIWNHHLWFLGRLPENLLLKIKKIGRFQLVFQIGKMQLDIQYHCIWDYKLMAEGYKIPRLMKGMLNLLMHCTPLKDRLERKLSIEVRSSRQCKWHKLCKGKKRLKIWLFWPRLRKLNCLHRL